MLRMRRRSATRPTPCTRDASETGATTDRLTTPGVRKVITSTMTLRRRSRTKRTPWGVMHSQTCNAVDGVMLMTTNARNQSVRSQTMGITVDAGAAEAVPPLNLASGNSIRPSAGS